MARGDLGPYCTELLTAALPGSPLRGPGADARSAPTTASRVASVTPGGGASVVGERVPQEDEDQDDAGGG